MKPFEILHAALEAEVGFAVKSNKPDQLRLQIYSERIKQQKQGNAMFDELSIFIMPDDELWIIHRDTLRKWKNDLEQNTPQV